MCGSIPLTAATDLTLWSHIAQLFLPVSSGMDIVVGILICVVVGEV